MCRILCQERKHTEKFRCKACALTFLHIPPSILLVCCYCCMCCYCRHVMKMVDWEKKNCITKLYCLWMFASCSQKLVHLSMVTIIVTDVIILSRSLSLGYIVFYGGHLQHETQASSPFNLEPWQKIFNFGPSKSLVLNKKQRFLFFLEVVICTDPAWHWHVHH